MKIHNKIKISKYSMQVLPCEFSVPTKATLSEYRLHVESIKKVKHKQMFLDGLRWARIMFSRNIGVKRSLQIA